MEDITNKENNPLEALNHSQRSRRTKSSGPEDFLQSMQKDIQVGGRTPLQDVNCRDRHSNVGLSRMVKMAQYGEVTPLSAPSGRKQAPRWTTKAKKSVLGDLGKESYSAPVVQYKRIVGALVGYKQDFESHLIEKEDYIKSLEDQITKLQASSVVDEQSPVTGLSSIVVTSTNVTHTPVPDTSHIPVTDTSHTHLTTGRHKMPHVLFKSTPEVILSHDFGDQSPSTPVSQQLSVDVDTCGTSHPTPLPLRLVQLDSSEWRGSPGESANTGDSVHSLTVREGTRSIGCSPIKIPVEHYESHSSSSENPSPDNTCTLMDNAAVAGDRNTEDTGKCTGRTQETSSAQNFTQKSEEESVVPDEMKQNSTKKDNNTFVRSSEKTGKDAGVTMEMIESRSGGDYITEARPMEGRLMDQNPTVDYCLSGSLVESNGEVTPTFQSEIGECSVDINSTGLSSSIKEGDNESAGKTVASSLEQNINSSGSMCSSSVLDEASSVSSQLVQHCRVVDTEKTSEYRHMSTNTDVISKYTETSDCSVNTSILSSNASTMTSTSTETKAYRDCSMNTSFVESMTSATNTDTVTVRDSSVNTSYSIGGEVNSVTCQTDPLITVGTIMNTDVYVNTNFENEVFGQEVKVDGAVVTKEVCSVAVSTSPSRLNVGRPSEVGLTELSYDELRLQLETACISNTLLRQELAETQEQREKMTKELRSVKESSGTVECRMSQLEKLVKAPFEAEISSLKTQQSQYVQSISELKDQLREKDEVLEKLETKHRGRMEFVKKENTTLQADLKRVYNQKKQEVEALKQEYAQEDYRRLYHKSQGKLKDMEAQLNAFTGLVTILEESHKSRIEAQSVLEEGFQQIKDVALKNKAEREDVQSKLTEWEEEKNLAREEMRVKEIQEQALRQTVDGLKSTVEDKDRQLEQMTKELKEFEEKVQIVEEKSAAQFSANKTLTEELHKAMAELTELRGVRDTLECEVTEGRGAASLLQQIADELTSQLTTVKAEVDKFEEDKGSHAASKESSRVEIADLILKLKEKYEELEGKTRLVTELQKLKAEQTNQITGLHSEVEEGKGLRVKLDRIQDQLQSVQNSCKESQLFAELEVSTLREALEETKKQCDMLDKMAASSEEEKAELEERLTALSNKHFQLQAELDYTKTQAHMMLLEQGSEVSSAVESLNKFTERMENLYADLQHRSRLLELQNQEEEADEKEISTNVTDSEKLQGHLDSTGPSLLSSVMRAISGVDDRGGGSTLVSGQVVTDEQSDHRTDLSVVGVCGMAIEDSKNVNTEDDSLDGSRLEEEGESRTNREDDDVTGSEARPDGKEELEVSLAEQIEGLFELVGNVISTVKHLDEVLMGNQRNLQDKIEFLEAALMQETSDWERKLKGVEEKLRSAELQLKDVRQGERGLRSELVKARGDLGERERELKVSRRLLEEKATALEEVVEQENTLQKCQEEVSRLQRELEEKVGENRVIQESLEDALSSLDQLNRVPLTPAAASRDFLTPGGSDRKYARENHFLKAELSKLRQQGMYAKDQVESLATKANHRQKILQHNVSKAEQEIVSLDCTVEKVRQLLRRHKDDVRLWADAKHVWNEVVYDKRLDDPSMLWR